MTTGMGVEAFGRALIRTGDLDPVYLMLEGAQLDRATLQRWCLGYWMFYHAGVASQLSEIDNPRAFWAAVRTGLDGDPDELPNSTLWGKFPRGTERRHFRGANSAKSVSFLSKTFLDPVEAAMSLERTARKYKTGPAPYIAIAAETQRWVGFGPWISFKVADMLDSVLGVPVDFLAGFPGNIFEAPAKGAAWAYWHLRFPGDPMTAEYLEEVRVGKGAAWQEWIPPAFWHLGEALGDQQVPHKPGQALRLQELETIFCKWKSHLNGHYEVGHDTREIKKALKGWGRVADICEEVLTEHQFKVLERR